jgi:hypothetical protein
MQNNPLIGAIEAIHWANCHARRVSAMHTGYRDGFLCTNNAVINCDDTAAVYAPRHFIFILTCGDATVAFNTPFCVADKFHSCHF